MSEVLIIAGLGLAAFFAVRALKTPAPKSSPATAAAAPTREAPMAIDDPALIVAMNMRVLEDMGLARRLTEGAGLKALGDFNQTVNLASYQAGLVPRETTIQDAAPVPAAPAPGPAK